MFFGQFFLVGHIAANAHGADHVPVFVKEGGFVHIEKQEFAFDISKLFETLGLLAGMDDGI